jgi:hypothetical protein
MRLAVLHSTMLVRWSSAPHQTKRANAGHAALVERSRRRNAAGTAARASSVPSCSRTKDTRLLIQRWRKPAAGIRNAAAM